MDEMGVAVDQAGRDEASAAVDDFGAGRGCRQLRLRADIGQNAAFADQRALLDQAEARHAARQGGEPGVRPDPRPSPALFPLAGHQISVSHRREYV